MFTRLKEEYKEGIIRHWRRNINERLMVIRMSNGPTETLIDDPHETRFLRDTEEITAGVPSTKAQSAAFLPQIATYLFPSKPLDSDIPR